MKRLNERLFSGLENTFGAVAVCNEGVQAQVLHAPDYMYRQGRLKAQVVDWGETYHVSCPLCNDTRKRLYISHLWGVRDPQTYDDMLHLCKCHNENCFDTRELHKQLHATVFPDGTWSYRAEAIVAPSFVYKAAPPAVITLPASVSLNELPTNHLVMQYLSRRGFSPTRLASRFGLRYCEKDDRSMPSIEEPRLVIPIYSPSVIVPAEGPCDAMGTRLTGWQARVLRSNCGKNVHKYLTATGTRRNHILYGLPHALKANGPLVIVEGIFDRWKVGPGGLALLGKTISSEQCNLITRHLSGRPVVVLLDHDAVDCALAVRTKLIHARRASGDTAPVVVGQLCDGRHDPGECSTAEIKDVISRALKHCI